MAEMISDSDDGSGDDYDRDEGDYSSEYDESDFEDMVHDSDLEYSDETESDSDSYVYPWPTSSDDSWASISSDDVIQKILLKLPTYDPPDSDEDDLKSASPSPSQFSDHGNDSVVEEDNNGAESELGKSFAAEAELEIIARFKLVPHPDDYDASDEMEPTELKPKTARKSSKILQPAPSITTSANTPSPPMSPTADEQKAKPLSIETPLSIGKPSNPPLNVPHSPIVDAEPIPEVGVIIDKLPKTSEDTKADSPKKPSKTRSDIGKKATSKPLTKTKAHSTIKTGKKPSGIKSSVGKGKSGKRPGTATAPASPISKRKIGKKYSNIKAKTPTGEEPNKQEKKRSHRRRKKKFQIDDAVEVLGKGPGVIRGIGIINKKLIYGIELTSEEAKGTSDGVYNDVRYFQCDVNRAVFVERPSLQKIRKERVKVRKAHNNRNNALLFGRVMDDLFEERLKTAKNNYEKAPRKLGPRDYGRIKGWVGGDSEYRNALPADHGDFLGERTRRRKGKQGKKEKKMGPRDIGTAHGYRAPKWAKDVNTDASEGFLEERGRKATLVDEGPKAKKLGPRDIGTAHGWKGSKMEEIEKKDPTKPKAQIARKEGPRDIGTAHGWKGTKASKKTEAPKKKKKEKTPPPKKLGPRDMGRTKYKGTKLDKKDKGGDDFLGERTKKGKAKAGAEQGKIRKEGPREIGRNRTFSRPNWDPDKQKQQQE